MQILIRVQLCRTPLISEWKIAVPPVSTVDGRWVWALSLAPVYITTVWQDKAHSDGLWETLVQQRWGPAISFLAFKRRFNSGALDRKYVRWTLTVKRHGVNGDEGDIPENPCVD